MAKHIYWDTNRVSHSLLDKDSCLILLPNHILCSSLGTSINAYCMQNVVVLVFKHHSLIPLFPHSLARLLSTRLINFPDSIHWLVCRFVQQHGGGRARRGEDCKVGDWWETDSRAHTKASGQQRINIFLSVHGCDFLHYHITKQRAILTNYKSNIGAPDSLKQ